MKKKPIRPFVQLPITQSDNRRWRKKVKEMRREKVRQPAVARFLLDKLDEAGLTQFEELKKYRGKVK